MLFMVNVGFGKTHSGIESAQMTRLKLFKKYQYPVKILTVEWFPALHANMLNLGIADQDVINLYEYFTETSNEQLPDDLQPATLADIAIPTELHFDEDKSQGTHYVYSNSANNKRIEVVNWTDRPDLVDTVNYFSSEGSLTHSETYDSRGYLSARNYFFHEDGQLKAAYRVFYSATGQEKITINYGRSRLADNNATRIELVNYKGYPVYFTTQDDFKRFFLDEINRDYGLNNSFIVDRGLSSGSSVMNMLTPSYKTMFIHATHLSDFRDPNSKLLNNNYEYAFKMIKQWTNLIVSTKYQRDQILDRFGHLSQKIHAIPVGVIEDDVLALPKVAMRDRQPHSLVTVSRLDRQKSVDLQVAAVAELVDEFPDVQLHIYGTGSTQQELAEYAKELGIADHVQLHGWVYDKQAALNDKQIFLETSNSEAFGISMMEAQSYGLPLITTPVESATELIDDGVSGMIVSDIIEGREKLVKMMADDIRRLFKDDDQLQAMSDAAYLHRMNFSSEAVWHNWQLWVADVEV